MCNPVLATSKYDTFSVTIVEKRICCYWKSKYTNVEVEMQFFPCSNKNLAKFCQICLDATTQQAKMYSVLCEGYWDPARSVLTFLKVYEKYLDSLQVWCAHNGPLVEFNGCKMSLEQAFELQLRWLSVISAGQGRNWCVSHSCHSNLIFVDFNFAKRLTLRNSCNPFAIMGCVTFRRGAVNHWLLELHSILIYANLNFENCKKS